MSFRILMRKIISLFKTLLQTLFRIGYCLVKTGFSIKVNNKSDYVLWIFNPFSLEYLFSDNYDEIAFRLLTSGRLQAETYSSVNSLQPINDNWHFAALSYDFDKNLMYFYLDDEFQGSTFITSSVNGFNDPPFCIGVDYQDGSLEGPFNGIIDDKNNQ